MDRHAVHRDVTTWPRRPRWATPGRSTRGSPVPSPSPGSSTRRRRIPGRVPVQLRDEPRGVLATYARGPSATAQHTFADRGPARSTAACPTRTAGSPITRPRVTVTNVAPTVGAITAPLDPSLVGHVDRGASATFTDPGTADTHTAVWDWGDGTTSAGTVTEAERLRRRRRQPHLHGRRRLHRHADRHRRRRRLGHSRSTSTSSSTTRRPGSSPAAAGSTPRPGPTPPTRPSPARPTSASSPGTRTGARVPTGNTEFQFKAGRLQLQEHQLRLAGRLRRPRPGSGAPARSTAPAATGSS